MDTMIEEMRPHMALLDLPIFLLKKWAPKDLRLRRSAPRRNSGRVEDRSDLGGSIPADPFSGLEDV